MLNDFSDWWRLLSALAYYPSWWFLAYPTIPLLTSIAWWARLRRHPVDVSNAWNQAGRHWREIGRAGSIASIVLYVGSSLWFVPSVPVVKQARDRGAVASAIGVVDAAAAPAGKSVTLLRAFQKSIDRQFVSATKQHPALAFIKEWYAWLHGLPVTLLMCGGLGLIFSRPGARISRQETDLASTD